MKNLTTLFINLSQSQLRISSSDATQEVTFSENEIRELQKNYAEKLFDDTRDESIYENESNEELMGPEIIQSEVENALRAMKNGKAPEHDDVQAEVLKIMDPRMLTDLFNKIYKVGQIQETG